MRKEVRAPDYITAHNFSRLDEEQAKAECQVQRFKKGC